MNLFTGGLHTHSSHLLSYFFFSLEESNYASNAFCDVAKNNAYGGLMIQSRHMVEAICQKRKLYILLDMMMMLQAA